MTSNLSKASRREFLKLLGWSTAGISATCLNGCAFPPLPHRNDPTAEEARLWIALLPDGTVEFVSPRAEMGQGISIGIQQIIAEEIRIDLHQVRYIHPRTDRFNAVKATVGSESILSFGPVIAAAAAAIRKELVGRADAKLGRSGDEGVIHGATFKLPDKQSIPLAELLAEPLLLSEDLIGQAKPVSFKAGRTGRFIGQATPTPLIKSLVTASQPMFVDDINLSDMVYARLLTSPNSNGGLASIAENKAPDIPGYVDFVQEDGLLAVVATNRNSLERVHAEYLRTASWDLPAQPVQNDGLSLSGHTEPGSLEHVLAHQGDIGKGKPQLDITLTVPLAAHAAMEPRTAIARYQQSKHPQLEIWTGSQDVTIAHRQIADFFDLSEDQIIIHNQRIGGGFGGKVFSGIELDAARLAKHVNKPVKLQWTREDEFRKTYFRPPSQHRIRATLNDQGRIESWWHAFKSGHVIFSSAFLPDWMQSVTSLIADKGAARGALLPYDVPNQMIEFEDVRLPIDTGPWRGLGAMPNCWAIETALDRLAVLAGKDPLAFRMDQLSGRHLRLQKVLQRAAALSSWNNRSESEDTAYGVACGIYKDMSYSATVAKVRKRESGELSVVQLWSVHDCGIVVNPDQVVAQVEGNLMWCLGSVLHEDAGRDGNSVSSVNFDSYTWASYEEAPAMTIDLIKSNEPPTGAGETAIVSGAAAITNAMSLLRGETILSLPVT
ncbi:xanthine dehydrogenase family protein molybdopterin-binding subunit [Sneathiella aquimaris]|uniref:xanthine dehydrogenase family protein molybdopterin-binding subunit n=1 Tax=Sneathiella aquimaris TaxID=2599305 RepID=UPI00146C1426|nr:molybdopterin cofactor-binding domain-containing protein [Sneathiella aquimaris]